MSYVIQAVIQNPHVPDYGVATIPFPLDREAYDPTLREIVFPLDIGDAISQDCLVKEIDSFYDCLKCLEGQRVNFDELDYLAKRLDSFSDDEATKFQAACHAFDCKSIRILINMTFCCEEATVISDFSKLEEVGKSHYLTVHSGVTVEELAKVDGAEVARQLIQSNRGIPTPYGLFFRNDMEMKELYRGRGFPSYVWDERIAELVISKPDGEETALFLPAAELEIEHFLQREGIYNPKDCRYTLGFLSIKTSEIVLTGGYAELREWNKFCGLLSDMSPQSRLAFSAAAEVCGAESLSQMRLLVDGLNNFELISGVADDESYGKYMIRESGKYNYDDSLDCYYNYEAFGEFLSAHEFGQFTKYGYLKCEEGSAFLDFFTQESPKPQDHQQRKNEMTMEMGGI